ncbi:hypothetical protein F5144DRAFT_614655 [Chaetomium tenue]|uniref:Uncharacterized protein n=1 Tax=Chaetomium tenue TaxID=1854479 RepID=A0ACB7NWI5_9PEZI|nr:hypothetical protein F5144DRAFT_614655 [Chaetomium globosum]
MPRKTPELDLDFNIFVDPSCLSAPMDDETLATMPPSSEEVQASAVVPGTPDELGAEATVEDAEQKADEVPEPEAEVTPTDEALAEEQPEPEIAEQEDVQTAEPPADEPSAPEDEETEQATLTEESSATAEIETDEPAPEPEQFDEPETETAFEAEPVEEPTPEAELGEEPVSEESVPEPAEDEEEEHQVEQASPQEEVSELRDEEDTAATGEPAEATDELEETNNTSAYDIEAPSEIPQEDTTGDDQDLPIEDVDTSIVESDMDEEERGRQPNLGDRKNSLRTEALIQAAARAVVAKIEKRKSGDIPQEGDELDNSLLSTNSRDTYVLGDDARSTANADSPSRRQSSESHARHIASRSISSDDAGDSSSHNERDDDVFSDRSARSSLYSLDQHDSPDIPSIKTPQAKESVSRRDSYASSQLDEHSSARTASNFSAISGLSQYDDPKLTFVPTHRETRMPFRTPSEIRAMHMTSPTPSVFNGSSPSRSSAHKHHHHHHQGPRSSGGPPSSISRLGSPTVSAQYSPKGRSTPPRFKSARKEAPLVLLHVTLLPLRWVWGDVLNTLDSVLQPPPAAAAAKADGPAVSSSSPLFEPSDPLKTLRDAWRELQDRVGDTVLERGILLPHPQNDYEVLEERLLEALELPLRRRARILECGHYVGPANVPEDGDSDDEGAEGAEGKTHWCGTCCGEIRCEDLGVGRVFRIKVYASNGLMRAGAWEACWKEMERVDVEVEPIVDLAVQSELEKLAVLQMELEEQRRRELDLERMPDPEPERKADPDARGASRQQGDLAGEADMDAQRGMMSSPAPSALQLAMRAATPQPSASNTLVRAATPSTYGVDASEERRLRDEERMREIYGETPAPPPQQAADQQHQHQQPQQQQHHYPPPPQQPQQQPQPQPQHTLPLLTDSSHHQHHPQDPYRRRPVVLDENAGFVDLLTQAFKVLLRDPKNVAIILLEREVEMELASLRMPEIAGLEGVVPAVAAAGPEREVVEAVEEVQQQQPAVVEEVPVVVEEEVKEQVVLETREGDAREAAEVEVRHIPRFELPADMCPPRGPEYPITMADEMPAEEQVIPQATTDEAAAEQDQLAGACGPNSSDSDIEEGENEEEEEPVAAAAPTSTFLPGPLVTERTTVRVFETVTQTVRVSVVTQTETVSTVVTAVPQTVEETVYETETVRITVSVPVDEQQQQQQQKKVKAKPAKGCQEKGGWF